MHYIRSDFPQNLTDDEVKWLLDNNVTTIVDLREKREYEKRPCRLEKEAGFMFYHLPVTGGGDKNVYLSMLDTKMDEIIDTIMNAKSNVLYFCEAGKDRTGVVSAIILKKLGYDEKTIIDDYMETRGNLLKFLTDYVKDHPEVDINTILPNERNIRAVLNMLE